MSTRHFFVFLSLVALLALPALAQEDLPGPSLPKMSNLAFGWVATSGLDPTLDVLTQFAPTMMCLRDYGYRSGAEAVGCRFKFGEFEYTSTITAVLTSLGPGLVRISHFSYDSNAAEVPGLPGVLLEADGTAIELSYAQRIGSSIVGVSVVPKDTSKVRLDVPSLGGLTAMTGESKTDFGVRVGGIVPIADKVRAGVEFSYQEDTGTSRINPALVPGATDWVVSQDDFITRCGVIGLSWQALPSTTLYGSVVKIIATGNDIGGDTDRSDASVVWIGAQHNVTDTLAFRANYLEGGLNVSMRWMSPVGVMNAGYIHNALRNAKDFLGDGNSAFISLAVGF